MDPAGHPQAALPVEADPVVAEVREWFREEALFECRSVDWGALAQPLDPILAILLQFALGQRPRRNRPAEPVEHLPLIVEHPEAITHPVTKDKLAGDRGIRRPAQSSPPRRRQVDLVEDRIVRRQQLPLAITLDATAHDGAPQILENPGAADQSSTENAVDGIPDQCLGKPLDRLAAEITHEFPPHGIDKNRRRSEGNQYDLRVGRNESFRPAFPGSLPASSPLRQHRTGTVDRDVAA